MTVFKKQNRIHSESGFSLIEVAIALMVIGILMASAIQTYRIYSIQRQENDTKNHISVVQAALSKYLEKYGKLPRPADRNIPIGTILSGKEAAIPTTLCTVSTATSCLATGGTVYVGDVPFSTLGIHYKNTLDPFGGKLTYAVTATLTDPTTFSDNGGGIRVLADNGTDIFAGTTPKAQFFVFSAGPDNQGTYSSSGVMIAACGAAGTNGTDTENCNGDLIFRSNYDTNPANLDTFHKYVRYFANGANNFDDLTGYQNTVSSGLWSMAPNMGSLINTNTGLNVLIGDQPPTIPGTSCPGGILLNPYGCYEPPLARMDVRGVVNATELRTKRICYATGGCPETFTLLPAGTLTPSHYVETPSTTGTFNATKNGTNGDGILCASNKALRGFSGSTGDLGETCTDSFKVSNTSTLFPAALFPTGDCAAGEYAVGINAAGIIICAP